VRNGWNAKSRTCSASKFKNPPRLRRILTWDGFKAHALRKITPVTGQGETRKVSDPDTRFGIVRSTFSGALVAAKKAGCRTPKTQSIAEVISVCASLRLLPMFLNTRLLRASPLLSIGNHSGLERGLFIDPLTMSDIHFVNQPWRLVPVFFPT